MRDYLLPKNTNQYKANLGCLTSLSIGKLTPEELKEAYKSQGYSIIAFSDFEFLNSHQNLCDDNFLAITSYKTSIENYCFTLYSQTEENVKIALQNKEQDIQKTVNEFIKKANENGYLVCIDHPAKSIQTFHDYDKLTGYFALEIADYSSLVEGHIEDNNHIYDRILRNSTKPIYPLACDGNINFYPFESTMNDSFGAFTMIYSEDLSYKNIISALKNGEFYSSTGPKFEEIYVEDNKIHIKCSPVHSIRLLDEGRDGPIAIAKENELLTEAVFEIDTSFMGRFMRLDIRDDSGNFANTVPYYFDLMGEQK